MEHNNHLNNSIPKYFNFNLISSNNYTRLQFAEKDGKFDGAILEGTTLKVSLIKMCLCCLNGATKGQMCGAICFCRNDGCYVPEGVLIDFEYVQSFDKCLALR